MELNELRQWALKGLENELVEMQRKIDGLKSELGKSKTATKTSKHRISKEGRERIAAAQRRRWALAKKSA